jgi:hypothetical protein
LGVVVAIKAAPPVRRMGRGQHWCVVAAVKATPPVCGWVGAAEALVRRREGRCSGGRPWVGTWAWWLP